MAEKGFGVKEINLIGASGTPTIESPNNLNLNAVNVAISTNVSIGGTLTVTGNISVGGTLTYEDVTNIDSIGIITARTGLKVLAGGANVVGVVTATSFVGNVTGNLSGTATNASIAANVTVIDNSSANETVYPVFVDGTSGSQTVESDSGLTYNPSSGNLTATKFTGSGASLTGIAVTEAPAVDYTITGDGSNYYFHGGGVDETDGNPDLYLMRGQKYRFNNTTGTGHPFRFTSTGADSATYSNGVTGDEDGVQFWTIPYDAPAKLFYVCTIHGGMVGNIYIRGANGQNDNVGITTISGTTPTSAGHLLNLKATTGDNFIRFDNTSDNTEWFVGTDSATRNRFDLWHYDGSAYDRKFSVDSGGSVNKPKNPAFYAYLTTNNASYTAGTIVPWANTTIDTRSAFETSGSDQGRYIIPATGIYYFGWRLNRRNDSRFDLAIYKNGALQYIDEMRWEGTTGMWMAESGHYLMSCTANQKIDLRIYSVTNAGSAQFDGGGNGYYDAFFGWMVG